MTKARLAAEASENRDSEAVFQNKQSQKQQAHAYKHMQSPTNSDHFNRQRIFSAESFGSHERQRIGSVDSFGSAQHSYANSSYLRSRLGTSTSIDGLEQPSVDSYSYDAQDNESYATPHGSDSFFGTETQRHKMSTSQYPSNSSSGYKNTYSSEQVSLSSPLSYSHHSTGKAEAVVNVNRYNTGSDYWKNDVSVRPSSPSSIPTVARSSSSFGASTDNEAYPYLTVPKFERAISAGAVVSNSVAESVLGPSNEYDDKRDVFYDYKPSAILTSPLNKSSSNELASPYTFPWLTTTTGDEYDDNDNNNNGDLNITQLQSEWDKYLNIDADDDKDDFPLSTFASKASTSRYVRPESNNHHPGNHVYSSPFQPVPEEHAFHNSNTSLSFDRNYAESFLDDDSNDQLQGSMFRRKKSRS
jgi:hypothetical protein